MAWIGMFAFIGATVIQLIDFQFASLFREIDPASNYLMSYFIAAAGAGTAVMLLLGRFSSGTAYGWKLGGGYVLIGLSAAGLTFLRQAAMPVPVAVLMCGFLLGIGNGMFLITFNYALQKETPASMTGRIFGIQNTVLSAVLIAAPLLGGTLVQTLGARLTFTVAGCFLSAVGLAGIGWGHRFWSRSSSAASAASLVNLEERA
ncbi:hypothetical protein AWM70_20570 [Paenibacillus yonginensis]|uniref:Major facilitator superfamily (MFS) profile domain-containing protein n=1 Tax=Paenibacillus yonginensis TaxID=1462996 RepID=A0A1B1N5J5_9BACL|nr:hypothetical protein [Paenibacillus yonginensis]ANS76677.1 hypothetical protein AWM70_20570 [Paenibacillus yonginensis]